MNVMILKDRGHIFVLGQSALDRKIKNAFKCNGVWSAKRLLRVYAWHYKRISDIDTD